MNPDFPWNVLSVLPRFLIKPVPVLFYFSVYWLVASRSVKHELGFS